MNLTPHYKPYLSPPEYDAGYIPEHDGNNDVGLWLWWHCINRKHLGYDPKKVAESPGKAHAWQEEFYRAFRHRV